MVTAAVVAGTVLAATASQAAVPSAAKSKTLIFHVVFSPFTLIAANNVRPKNSPVALGDEVIFHDQLFTGAGTSAKLRAPAWSSRSRKS